MYDPSQKTSPPNIVPTVENLSGSAEATRKLLPVMDGSEDLAFLMECYTSLQIHINANLLCLEYWWIGGGGVEQHKRSTAPTNRDGGGRGSRGRGGYRGRDDKLLGGLLASGFDEGSCLSRYQSVLYRKNSLHKPSPYLISKLRKYEDLHRRCGPYTESYNRTLKKLETQYMKNSSTGDCNYIVWLRLNGLGNRIITMVSAFLYALLTNRVLLVDYGTDMDDLFCEPFPKTTWRLPEDFPVFDASRKDFPFWDDFDCYGTLLQKNNRSTSNLLPPL
ncbi:hypothetical protein Tsubulata_038581 [Turnera subulata]|uniref:Fucosyltransferase n=1 Tax=Turnera subulata TaxID=218843 RepID=A0A9Q0JMS0_9ROSI|nr:hypothetical protein Tsubulata_038581 [Turnera subulata]